MNNFEITKKTEFETVIFSQQAQVGYTIRTDGEILKRYQGRRVSTTIEDIKLLTNIGVI